MKLSELSFVINPHTHVRIIDQNGRIVVSDFWAYVSGGNYEVESLWPSDVGTLVIRVKRLPEEIERRYEKGE